MGEAILPGLAAFRAAVERLHIDLAALVAAVGLWVPPDLQRGHVSPTNPASRRTMTAASSFRLPVSQRGTEWWIANGSLIVPVLLALAWLWMSVQDVAKMRTEYLTALTSMLAHSQEAEQNAAAHVAETPTTSAGASSVPVAPPP